MKDKDTHLIWESYNDRRSGDGYEELNFEKIPHDELKQLNADEAKMALSQLGELDVAIQKSTDRAFDDDTRRRRDDIHGRMKTLRDIINPPPPPPTDQEREERAQARQADRDKHENARRNLRGLKQQWSQDGTWEQISKLIPSVSSTTMFGPMSTRGDGGIPANLQRYIAMAYLLDGSMPSKEELNTIVRNAIDRNEIKLNNRHHQTGETQQ